MKADLGRVTFDPRNHYSGVLQQQGRVQLDADANEQQAIARHRVETGALDVIGPAGVPAGAPGFGITATEDGTDLLISGGRLYVDGVLCTNDDDVAFTAQPDLPPGAPGSLPEADGLHLAYLETWERHITAIEDRRLRETALGGPDTTTRTRTVWQVKLLAVTDPGGTLTADTPFAEWDALLQANLVGEPSVGTLAARSAGAEPAGDPLCVLPPDASYRRLENQLYRVEVHRGGDRSVARFKWSRDNGSVASALEAGPGGVVVNGRVITLADHGRDDLLALGSEQPPEWVELSDDAHELTDQHGELARVESVDPDARTVTLVAPPATTLDADRHPLVRRWDQRGDTADADGVAMAGDWQPLEDGVEVRFGPGAYRAGDHWTIPARTAIRADGGTVEWPTDPGGQPVPERPEGTPHRFVRLALVRRTDGVLSVVPGTDGRRVFPALTDIQPSASSLCSVVIEPGQDVAAAVASLSSVNDLVVCLRAGLHQLGAPLRFEGRGHVEVRGTGPGTRLVVTGSEQALVFSSCLGARVVDLQVEAGAVPRGGGRGDGLGGALSFLGTPSVSVERVRVITAGGSPRSSAAIAVQPPAPPQPPNDPRSQVRVEGCDLEVGHRQVGVLVAGAARVHVAGNRLRAGSRPSDDVLLADDGFQAALRRQLLSNLVVGRTGMPVPSNTNATVTVGGFVAHLLTDATLVRGRDRNDNEWQRLATSRLRRVDSPRHLRRRLLALASEQLRTRGAGGSNELRALLGVILRQETAAMDQGIVVGGAFAGTEVRIVDNAVDGAVQGIHVGLGAGGEGARIQAGTVRIVGNDVRVSLPASARGERHGLFVGSVDSLVVEDNVLTLTRAARNASLRVEGIRVFGSVGRRVVLRGNHTKSFTVGTTFAPIDAAVPAQPLWVITENAFESATTKVDIPGRPTRPGGPPGVPNPEAVRARVRGINDNFS